MNGIIIRTAALKDAPALAELMTQLGYPTSPVEMSERLAAILTHPDYHTLVAERQASVVGMVGVCTGSSYEKNGLYGRLLALVVADGHRGQGIGAALVKRAEEWIRSCGGKAMVVNSAGHRREAHHFYQRLGYKQTGLRLVKPLE